MSKFFLNFCPQNGSVISHQPMKLDRLIVKKIIKIVITRCQILRLKYTKFDFGWGSAPDPAGGAYSAAPDPDLRGLLLKGWRGRGRG